MNDFHKVAILRLEDGKQILNQLASLKISAKLEHNEETCTRGCAVTVELHVAANDIQGWIKFQEQMSINSVESSDYNPELLNTIFDPSKEEANCPACGFKFSTSLSECPDCGLCI